MIKWNDFHKKKPKKGWYLVAMDIGPLCDHEPEIEISDLVCVAHYDPQAGNGYEWHSSIFDNIAITHWAKINLPLGLDEPK